MSLINMLSWWQWALLSAVPPAIVLLYFLKLKRTPLEVPSTFLWRKSIEDLHVNSIWQRLRRSLLLFLQILFVLLLMAALVRPGWSGSQLIGSRYVFLIDNSASMQASDVKPTRLDEAKRRVAELIEQMASGDVVMIVSFSSAAQVQQGFTDNRRELLSRLQEIRPTNETTSLDEAIRVAAGLTNSQRAPGNTVDQPSSGSPATLYLFSDGRFPDVQNFKPQNLKLVYVPIGLPGAANVGITSFSIRRREDNRQQLQAFGRLQNFGPATVTTQVDLLLNDELVDSSTTELEARGAAGVVFDLGEVVGGVLKLVARTGGELKVDDEAWAAIDPPNPSQVLVVSPGNDALKLALQTESAAKAAHVEFAEPTVFDSKEYLARADSGYYALIIYDQCRPPTMPQANTLFIGRLPPEESWGGLKDDAAGRIPAPQIIDVETTHPLLNLIDLGNVRFAESTMLRTPPGATVLITTATGPLLAIAPRGGYEDAVLGAEIVGQSETGERFANTDWPLRVSFPVFMFNTLNYFGDASTSGRVPSIQPGRSIALKGTGSAQGSKVRSPAGRVSTFDQKGSVQFSDTKSLGVYLVEETGRAPRHFAVNLFDPAESNIEPRSKVQVGFDEVSGQANWEGGRLELWRPLLIAVLGVLCLEWYIYNRRIYV
jgi:hypothetical protein